MRRTVGYRCRLREVRPPVAIRRHQPGEAEQRNCRRQEFASRMNHTLSPLDLRVGRQDTHEHVH
jgi:dTDP-4-amino-4,6-dideoxygalactose transaminase